MFNFKEIFSETSKTNESYLEDDIETKNILDSLEDTLTRVFKLNKGYKDPTSNKHLKRAMKNIADASDSIESFYEYEFGKEY